jgi:hypothetical protein
MELVDRYLKTVGTYLPKEQKDDILRELSENIRSEIEDKETELGRPLTDAEQEAVVKQQGNPLLVAGRYRQDKRSVAFGRQWIGPELFPFYIKVLSFNLGLTSLVLLTIFVGLYAGGQQMTLSGLVRTMFVQLLLQFAIITGIFAAVNAHLTKYPDQWDPRKPGRIQAPRFDWACGSKNEQRVPRFESISHFIALGVSVVWLRAVQRSRYMVFGPAAAVFTPAPVWHYVYWPLVLVALAGMIQTGTNLFYPRWVTFRSVARMAMNAASLAIVYFLLRAGVWIELKPNGTLNGHQHGMAIVNQSIFYSLLIAGLILVWMLFLDLRGLLGRRPQAQPVKA